MTLFQIAEILALHKQELYDHLSQKPKHVASNKII